MQGACVAVKNEQRSVDKNNKVYTDNHYSGIKAENEGPPPTVECDGVDPGLNEDVILHLLSEHVGHREKLGNTNSSALYGLVTKLLTKKDPEYHCAAAKLAIQTEFNKLTHKDKMVWDLGKPREWAEVRSCDKTATTARIFPIVSLKNAESQNPKYKGRIVLQGSDVRDVNNQCAMFGEVSSTPTNLNTMRC